MSRVRISVGPVPAITARTWLENSLAIVRAVRRVRADSLDVTPPVLDLIEAYLSVWSAAAERSDRFEWIAEVDSDDLEIIATHWRQLASLSDDQLASLGCAWAPEWTAPMYDALVAAFVEALSQDQRTRDVADDLRRRPPGTRGD